MAETHPELTARLRENPRQCPNCQGHSIARLDKGAMIVGKRLCKDCGCLWEPPWSRFTIFSGLIICCIGVVGGAWGAWTQVPAIISGEAFNRMREAETLKQAFAHIAAPIVLAVFACGAYFCIAALRGKRGQGHVLNGGKSVQN